MATLDELTTQFLVPQAGGLPFQFDNSLITPIVDDDLFNNAIGSVLSSVGTASTPAGNQGHYILIHNWWLGLRGGKGTKGDGFGNFETRPGQPYFLDGPPRFTNLDGTGPIIGGTPTLRLIKILKDKAHAGVDVRVMGWMAFGITDSIDGAGYAAKAFRDVNGATIRTIADLRRDSDTGPNIGMRAIADGTSHLAGASHFKMLIVGTPTMAVGFTGGIDFEYGRWSTQSHAYYTDDKERLQSWHDVVAQVEGPAVKGLYDWYKAIWDENISRKPRVYKTVDIQPGGSRIPAEFFGHAQQGQPGAVPPLPAFAAPPGPNPGTHRVQSLRTAPQSNFEVVVGGLPESPALSFAPSGLQEFQLAVQKAIGGAKRYIYIEDQAFLSAEIMSYIYTAIRANTGLKVILVTGGPDPNDLPQPAGYLTNALNFGLLQGNNTNNQVLTDTQRAQVRFFTRLKNLEISDFNITSVANVGDLRRVELDGPLLQALKENELAKEFHAQIRQGEFVFQVVANPALGANDLAVMTVKRGPFDILPLGEPQVGACKLASLQAIVVHSKITVIDDAFAIIGSANCMRRSLYTDLEHSISFVDTGTTVRDFRTQLFADHFEHPTAAAFNDIDDSLHAWNRLWGPATSGPAPVRPPHVIQVDLPLPPAPLSQAQKDRYDLLQDVDSRESWGGFFRLRRVKNAG